MSLGGDLGHEMGVTESRLLVPSTNYRYIDGCAVSMTVM